MASKSICSACIRALRQESRQHINTTSLNRLPLSQRIPHQRAYATSKSTTFNPTTLASPRPKQGSQAPSNIKHFDHDKFNPTAQDGTPNPPHPYRDNKQAPPAPKDFNYGADAALDNSAQLLASSLGRSVTEPYIAYGRTEDLFLECSRQCSYTMPSALSNPPTEPPMNAAGEHLGEGTGFWLTPKSKGGLGLDVTFQSWAQVLYLHMWMLTVRFRCFPKEYVSNWHQNLLDHFFYAAEDRMATWHGMSARGVRNKNLKDQWQIWRGVQLGYDEGLIRGDAVMAGAIWRSIFKSDPEVDVADVALVTAYVMSQLQQLSKMADFEVTDGRVKFGSPKNVQNPLQIESLLMRRPVTEAELKELKADA